MLIFPTLSANIQRPNYKSAQRPHPAGRVTYSPCPLYSFILKSLKENIYQLKGKLNFQSDFKILINFFSILNFDEKFVLWIPIEFFALFKISYFLLFHTKWYYYVS